MSDFTQTMKNWRRMCDSFEGCLECPLERCPAPSYNRWDVDMSFDDMEKAIDKWAEKHPEPQYPTWGQWLGEQYGWSRAYELEIPADIAEKLGIKPKEEENG